MFNERVYERWYDRLVATIDLRAFLQIAMKGLADCGSGRLMRSVALSAGLWGLGHNLAKASASLDRSCLIIGNSRNDTQGAGQLVIPIDSNDGATERPQLLG